MLPLFRRREAACDDEAQRVLEVVGLWSKRNAFASELSYGQRKLLEIARVLANAGKWMCICLMSHLPGCFRRW